ncbi:hypothetical protein B0J14DRAFT_686760 [Halenospora varia]|nr:hypothetical protein B0J14DRAFT_686760 [Halenospora varia]
MFSHFESVVYGFIHSSISIMMYFLSLILLSRALICDASQVNDKRKVSGAPFRGSSISSSDHISISTTSFSVPRGTGSIISNSKHRSTNSLWSTTTTHKFSSIILTSKTSPTIGRSSITSSNSANDTSSLTSTAFPSSTGSTGNSRTTSTSITSTLNNTFSVTTIHTDKITKTASPSTSGNPRSGTLPISTTSSYSSSTKPGSSTAPFTFRGTWSPSADPSPLLFSWFGIPTTTIAPAAATSEAVLLGRLFFALHANQQWITDAKRRSQHLNDLKKSRDEMIGLSNALDKRNLISSFVDIFKDVANLVPYAVQVVNNLVDAVDGSVLPIGMIEALTDTLAEIGKDLQEKEDPKTSLKDKSSTSNSPSCTGSTAVPICTKTVSLSTSFSLEVPTVSFAMATITKTACKTTKIVGCTGSGRTPTITTSTSGLRAAFTAVSLHTEDDPDVCGEEEDFTAPQRRSIAGRIQLERRAKGGAPVSFGTCVVPEGFAVDFPGYPKTTNIFDIDQANQISVLISL